MKLLFATFAIVGVWIFLIVSTSFAANTVFEKQEVDAAIPEDEVQAGGKGGGGGRGGGGRGGKRPSGEGGPRGGGSETLYTRLYDTALQLKGDGHCDRAIPILECLAQREDGFDMAAVPLGQCLIETPLDNEVAIKDERSARALYWLTRAADHGDYHAQGYLSQAYIGEHLTPNDPVAAGKWYLLFDRNPVRRSLGLGDLPLPERQHLYDHLSDADWEVAELEAQAWQKQWQIEPVSDEWITQENCSPRELVQLAGLRPGRGGDKSASQGSRRPR